MQRCGTRSLIDIPSDFLQKILPLCRGRSMSEATLTSPLPANQDSSVSYVLRAREHLDEHWARNVPLDELANVAGVSKFHLARRFAAVVGMPPHAYQNRLRVQRAMAMLREGASVYQVALRTGFSDASHLCRHFKRFAGTTPGRFARGHDPRGVSARRG
jgi:AraC-like DNA-binding protein